MERRNFLAYSGSLFAGVMSLSSKLFGKSSGCQTDEDVQGPFLRAGAPERNDLAVDYKGSNGAPLEVRGKILSDDCITPVPNALIELWHAGPDGQYDEHSDRFVFRGRVRSGINGDYYFRTLLPKGYKDGVLDRPAHIHYIVNESKHKKLVTQLYFKGDPKLDNDIFIQRNNGKKRAVAYPQDINGVHQVVFDIVLTKS